MKYRLFLGAISLVFASGCGGARIESGVDQQKTGEELDAAEIEDICEGTADYANETYTVEDRCGFAGLTAALHRYTESLGNAPDSELQSDCEREYDACAERVENEPGDRCDQAPDSLGDCTSTVNELETCYADTLDEVLEELRKLPSCDEVSGDELNDFLERDTDLSPEVQSCNTVAQSCPDGYRIAREL